MSRIANVTQLQAELRDLLSYVGSRRPSRVQLATRLAGLSQRVAGISYGVEGLCVVFSEGRKPVPFNIDVIREINQTWVPIVSLEGIETEASLKFVHSEYSGPLTNYEERAGMRREVRVDIQYPVGEDESDSERIALNALTAVGKKFGFSVRQCRPGYQPVAVQTKWKARERVRKPGPFGF